MPESNFEKSAVDSPPVVESTHSFPSSHSLEATQEQRPVGARSPLPAAPGEFPQIAGYEILEVLGRGGMGVVYKARQIGLKRLVALKMILAGGHAGEMHLSRFRAEAESAARLQHPNIVQVYEVGESGGFPFFSQEYVEGGTLSQRLKGTPQPAGSAAEVIALLAEAIDYAHQKGVVHRDLKPANILLTSEATSPREETSGLSRGRSTVSGSHALSAAQAYRFGIPKIADFGLAKQLDNDSGQTESGSILGTPSYMAPEQAGGRTHEIGPAADTYALGAILYELLTGRPPFRGESSLETLEQVRTQEPVHPRQLQPKIPADLETICLKCLRKEIAKRYNTAGDLAADLRAFLEGRPISARPVGGVERAWRWCRRKPWTAAFLAASVLVVALLLTGAWYRQQLLQSQQLAQANEDLVQTQKYYSEVNQARELAASAPLGWTWRAEEAVANAAKSPERVVNRAELRGLAAQCLSRFDLRGPAVLAQGIDPAELAFSPDGKRLAIGQLKNSLMLSVFVHDVETQERVATHSFATAASSLERLFQGTRSFQEGICSLAYSVDGRWLAIGTKFGKIVRWDLSQSDPQPVEWQAHGAKEGVLALTFNPDGSGLISGSEGKGLKFWQISDGWKERVLLPETSAIFDVKFSASGVLALSATSGLQLFLSDSLEPVSARAEDIFARRVAMNQSGRSAASKGSDAVFLVDTRTGRQTRKFELTAEDVLVVSGDRSSVAGIHFSPDEAYLATAWADKRVRIWDVAAGRVVATVAVPGDTYPLPLFSPDGRHLAIAAERQTLLYDLHPSNVHTTIAQTSATIQAIDFAANDRALLTCSDRGYPSEVADSSIAWWDVNSGKLRRQSRVEGFLGEQRVRFSALPASIAAHPQSNLAAVSSSMLGARLVSESSPIFRGSLAHLPDMSSGIEISDDQLEPAANAPHVEVRADPLASNGRAVRVAAGAAGREVIIPVPRECRKDATTTTGWATYAAVRVERKRISGPAFNLTIITSQNRNSLPVASASLPDDDYHWHLIDVNEGIAFARDPAVRFAVSAPETSDAIEAVWVDCAIFVPYKIQGIRKIYPQGPLAFSPTGQRLWGVLDGGQVVGWNVPELTVASSWNIGEASTILGKFSLGALTVGGKWVVTGSNSGDAFALSAATGKLEKSWRWPNERRSIRSVALDPGEDFAAIGADNGQVRLMKIPSWEEIATLSGHNEAVESLTFSRDGNLLVTGSHDRTVRVWRKSGISFEHLITLPATGRVRCVRITRDGRKIAVLCEAECAVRIWHLDRLNEKLKSLGLGW